MEADWLALYLAEDLGPGDVTSEAVFAEGAQGVASIVTRERCFVAGLATVQELFLRVGVAATPNVNDGSWVDAQQEVMRVAGPIRGVLAGERTALNLLGRMSGVATRTRALVEQPGCSGTRIAGTRKTMPGLRHFDKEAIAMAGGEPHRMGLWDEAMVKDNHRAAAGSVDQAVARVRAARPDIVVTAEVESLEDAMAAARAGAHWLLIDNQDPETGRAWAEKVWDEFPHIHIEASGGIRADEVERYAWADRVSLGALTTDARSIDFSMEWA